MKYNLYDRACDAFANYFGLDIRNKAFLEQFISSNMSLVKKIKSWNLINSFFIIAFDFTNKFYSLFDQNIHNVKITGTVESPIFEITRNISQNLIYFLKQ